MKNILCTEHLTKIFYITRFGRKKIQKKAVVDINLIANKGEVIGLYGPNGSGKSTIIRLISGVIQPTSGKILIKGFDMKENPIEAKSVIGFIPEYLGFYDYMTADKLLRFYGFFYGTHLSSSKINDLLTMVGLEGNEQKKIKVYSYGMKKRLGLALAMINDPELIVMDEPTIGLDQNGVEQFYTIVTELKEKKRTFLFSSHLSSEIKKLCDRVYILNNGQVTGCVSSDDI